ncbi:TrmH family RNA methyltransferase [Saccharospirillum sp.]|uniref:TrmH family RNA methyltransferase n=1 Tax=Saccharospirillum sp. TaxID=2033801 RepID=UPI0034A05F69
MKLDDIKKLHQKKYRSQFGHYLVEGEHLVLELQRAAEHQPALRQAELLVTETYADWQSPLKTQLISSKKMAQISDTKTPQGIVAVVPIPPASPSPESANQAPQKAADIAIYLHEIQDPGNLGTILRTLAWFSGFRCLLSPGSVDPYNPKVVRASMGAIFHVSMELDVPLENLAGRFDHIGSLDMSGQPLTEPGFQNIECYVFGNEARGIPHEALANLNPTAFTIPGSGLIESLNLASAVNLCVYERVRHQS